jgi:hypothetical protein
MPSLNNSLSLKRLYFTLSLTLEIPVLVLNIILILNDEETLINVYAKALHLDDNSGLLLLIIITRRYSVRQFYKKTIELLNIILFFKSYTLNLVFN